ncbi:MAG: aminotransferase class III-fold pyridoxal phosphate-dependent enzyme [Bacteroidota bacterium]
MPLFPVYPLFDLEPVRGQGAYVYDQNDRAYLDFYGGHAVISIGHSHPHYVQRLQEQIAKLAFYSNSVQNPLQQELAQRLGKLSGCPDYQLFLCNSGAEANENALKMVSFATGKKKIIAFHGAFHGRTSAAVNITENDRIKAPINSTFPVDFLPMGDLDAVETALKEGDVAAVIIEGIQGIAGIYVPEPAFLEALSALCKHYEACLILDEIQSGFGRSGHFFAFQQADIEPDIITMAKGMGNGFPVGGILLHPRFEASYGLLGTTFGGNHLACVAVLAVLDVLEQETLLKNAQTLGAVLIPQLAALPGVQEVRGMGLMIGLQLDQPAAPIRKRLLFEQGVFTGSAAQKETIRLLPPLNITPGEVERLLQALRVALQQVAA